MRNPPGFSFQQCCHWASALSVPRTESQAQTQIWLKQVQSYSKLSDGSRTISRKQYLWTTINPGGRTLGVHYQLFIHSLPQERGFYSWVRWSTLLKSKAGQKVSDKARFCWVITTCQAWDMLFKTSWVWRAGTEAGAGPAQGWGSCWAMAAPGFSLLSLSIFLEGCGAALQPN